MSDSAAAASISSGGTVRFKTEFEKSVLINKSVKDRTRALVLGDRRERAGLLTDS
jgi:hypothetical protein